jgi:hypothetical protein
VIIQDSLAEYFGLNFSVLSLDIQGFTVPFTLEDLDNIYPYERDLYISMILSKLDEIIKQRKK